MLSLLVLLVSAFLPLIYTIVALPDYDGMRHYLFILPMIAAICGIGLVDLAAWRPAAAAPVFVLMLCGAAVTVSDLRELPATSTSTSTEASVAA